MNAVRKIVQIAATQGVVDGAMGGVTALCDDGTVWELYDLCGDGWSDWRRLPAIPQTEEPNA